MTEREERRQTVGEVEATHAARVQSIRGRNTASWPTKFTTNPARLSTTLLDLLDELLVDEEKETKPVACSTARIPYDSPLPYNHPLKSVTPAQRSMLPCQLAIERQRLHTSDLACLATPSCGPAIQVQDRQRRFERDTRRASGTRAMWSAAKAWKDGRGGPGVDCWLSLAP